MDDDGEGSAFRGTRVDSVFGCVDFSGVCAEDGFAAHGGTVGVIDGVDGNDGGEGDFSQRDGESSGVGVFGVDAVCADGVAARADVAQRFDEHAAIAGVEAAERGFGEDTMRSGSAGGEASVG